MKSPKVLFLEASGGGGHISITTAIIQSLQKKYPYVQTERADVIPPLAHKLYQLASRQFVNAYMLLYKATDSQHGEIFASKINHIISREKLNKIITESQPDLIFSNYSLAINEIPKILKKIDKPIPSIIFIPDPFTFHSTYLSKKADATLVSTLAVYQSVLNSGILARNIEITGHPVREEFISQPADIRTHKKQLGLDPDMFTIFGGSGHGAEKTLEILMHLGAKPGGNLIKRLVRSANLDYKTYYKLFLKIFRAQYKDLPPFQAICVCGDNTELKEELEMLNYPSYIKPVIHVQSKNMAGLIHASDIVVGKAGPNIIFESAMAGKPFIATYHIKGQEEGNIDFIKSAELGFVEENPQKTAYLIETILKNKTLLNRTKEGISFVREKHKSAAEKIADQIIKQLKTATTP